MGYYINLANQGFIAIVGIIGNFGIEIAFSLISNNLWAASDVIKYNLDELQIGEGCGESATVRGAKLRNIFVQIQDWIGK